MPLTVEVVSPEQILFSGEGEMVVARTTGGGDIAFQPADIPFIGALSIWPAKVIADDGSVTLVAVHGGFVEVSNDRVTILSDVAELPDQIDVARAQRALETAEAAVRADPLDEEASAAFERARVRLEVAGAAGYTH